MNCWEFKKCGREPGGTQKHLGVCKAAIERRLDGVHGGSNGGRACWIIAGTMCGGQEQGTFAVKYHNCEQCDFYKLVRTEEGAQYKLSILLLRKLDGPGTAVPEKKVPAFTAVS